MRDEDLKVIEVGHYGHMEQPGAPASTKVTVTSGKPPTVVDTVVRAALAAVPYVGGPLEVIVSDVRARQAARAETLVASIALAVGEETLALRLADDPRAEALFVNAVNAALRTGYEAKRQLLARVVANALQDGAILDDAELLVNTLEDLEAPHIAALVRLEAEWLERLHTDVSVVNWGSSPAWQNLPEPIRAVLVRVGAAKPSPQTAVALEGPRRAEGITDWGLSILKQLRGGDS